MYAPARHRTASALAAAGIVAAACVVMLAGLAAHMPPVQRREALAVLALSPPMPRPSPPPEEATARSAPRNAPSRANLHARATPIVAPPPPLPPLIVPPPVVTAPKAGTGATVANGASDRPGPGQGAGGIGTGTGGGGDGGDGEGGDGEGGDGEGGEATTRPRQIHGRLHFSDLPTDLREAHAGGELKLQYRIGVDGRVSDCRILSSSGRADLDATTCRLITERFRFRPSKDARGRPVPAIMVETHGWFFPPESDEDGGKTN